MNRHMEMLKINVLFVVCVVSNIGLTDGQTGTQAKALYTRLFITDSYNSRIRPSTNQSLNTVVNVDLILTALNEVNTVQGTLKVTGYLQIRWTDEFLQWTPSSYGNLQEYHWPQDEFLQWTPSSYGNLQEYHWSQKEVWKPDISLANSFLDFNGFGSDYVLIENKYNGSMTWTPFEVFISTCSLDVTKFPFDTQTCRLKFVSWSYTRNEVSLTGGNIGFGLDDFAENPEWTILSRDWSLGDDPDDDVIIFVIKIRRNPAYAMLTVILPIIVLSILNVLTFVIPGEGKIDYAVTIFLTFAVYFGLIASILPESVAILTVQLILMTASSTMTCVVTIVQARCYTLDDDRRPIPKFLLFLTRLDGQKIKQGGKRVHKVHVKPEDPLDAHKGKIDDACDVGDKPTNQDTDDDVTNDVTWKELVEYSDRGFFCVFGLFVILSTSITFIIGTI